MAIKNIFVFFILLTTSLSYAQLTELEVKEFRGMEDSLRKIAFKVFYSKKEQSKFEANKQFLNYWNVVLANDKSMQYPFDSLKLDVSILRAPDNKFRIITWNLFKEDGTHAFFGFLQVNNSKTIKKGLFKKETTHSYEVFQLIDKSGTVKTPESYVGEPNKWFGMLYADVIKSDDDYYTLIGWDGNDKLTQRKFIDILYFKADGTPIFGKDVFKFPGKFAKRIMFEYASEVSMSLKYHDTRKQIIFSHLAPNTPDPLLEGQFQYYGPDGSFDALSIKKGKWDYVADVDVKNLKGKNDNVKKPEPNKQTPIYKP